jgi:hypothetical protein
MIVAIGIIVIVIVIIGILIGIRMYYQDPLNDVYVAVVGKYLLSKENYRIVASEDMSKIRVKEGWKVHHLRALPKMKQDIWRELVPDEVYRGERQVNIKEGDFLGALPEANPGA